jgi:hypothetical protein
MLVMPKPDVGRSLAIPRPSSATDNLTPIDRTVDALMVMRRAREWRTALVSASCTMPTISRSTPSPKRGSSSRLTSPQRLGDVLAIAHVGTKRADRTPRLGHVRARQIDCRLELRGDARRQRERLPPRGLQLHEDRG